MQSHLRKPEKIWSAAIALFLVAITFFPVLAQAAFSIIIYPPELDDFPKVTLYLDAYDGQGKFIPGLDLNSFMVYEDGFEMPVNETSLLEPGLHSIIAKIMMPLVVFGIFSGFYLYLNPGKRKTLSANHAINNLIVVLLALLQIIAGAWVYKTYVLGG